MTPDLNHLEEGSSLVLDVYFPEKDFVFLNKERGIELFEIQQCLTRIRKTKF